MSEPASQLADVIRSVVFTPVRLRRSYAMGDVDAFLDQAAQAADEGRDLAAMVAQARFTTRTLAEGYAMGEVDDFLDLIAARSAPGTAER